MKLKIIYLELLSFVMVAHSALELVILKGDEYAQYGLIGLAFLLAMLGMAR